MEVPGLSRPSPVVVVGVRCPGHGTGEDRAPEPSRRQTWGRTGPPGRRGANLGVSDKSLVAPVPSSQHETRRRAPGLVTTPGPILPDKFPGRADPLVDRGSRLPVRTAPPAPVPGAGRRLTGDAPRRPVVVAQHPDPVARPLRHGSLVPRASGGHRSPLSPTRRPPRSL